jgi:hypothetical protein
MKPAAPGHGVLRAFGVGQERLVPLTGGQGGAWRAGRAVLKPVTDVAEAKWVAIVLADLPEAGFRISRPIATAAAA